MQKNLKAFTVQPKLTPPEKECNVNGIFEMTKRRIKYIPRLFETQIIHVMELPNTS